MTSPTTSDPAHPADPAPTRGRSAALLLAVIAASAIVAVGLGAAFGPHHQTVSTSQTGNERLADSIQSLPGSFDGFRSLSVAEIGPNGPVFAGIGDADPAHSGAPGPDTVFELGSITKTFTGALFADAIERGEVSPDDPLSQYLDALTGTPAGAVTLASLSQHSSGLPGLGETSVASTLESLLLNENSYASTSTEQLIADAVVAATADQGTVYSNFAVALLGTALVEAAGVDDYATLLRERLTEPLGMDHTVVAATANQVPEDAVPGYLLNGTRAPRWWGEGYLPAGSATFTTASDLAIWAQANLNGTAPGAAALQPTAPMGTDTEIGWGWLTSPSFDGTGAQTWHNGATGGFRTFLTLDLAAGNRLPHPVEQRRSRRGRGPRVRHRLLDPGPLLLLWISGPWFAVGGWVWGLALAPTLAAAAVLILRAARGPRMPFLPARRAWLWWPLAVAGLAAAAGITVLW